MIEIVWEYVVKEKTRGQFELAYGPGGAWSNLLADSLGFRGITMLRDMDDPRRYLTIDIWDTLTLWKQALSQRNTEYTNLKAVIGEWIESRREVGSFKVLTQATVHPTGRVRGSKAGKTRRRRR